MCVRTVELPVACVRSVFFSSSDKPDWDLVRKMEKQIRAEEAPSTLLPPGCMRDQCKLPQEVLSEDCSLPPPPRPSPHPSEHLFHSGAGRPWIVTSCARSTPCLSMQPDRLWGDSQILSLAMIHQGSAAPGSLVKVMDVDAGLIQGTDLVSTGG